MANEKPRYWTSLEEYNGDPETLENNQREFPEDPFENALNDNGSKTSRRDFLKVMGFGLTAATLAACQQTPKKYIMPFVNKPADSLPGTPNYYASTFYDGVNFQPILVKSREGRPIFIEGNPASGIADGVTPRAAAHVLGLYDEQRLKQPSSKGKTGSDWNKIDDKIESALANASAIRIVTPTVLSPSTKKLVGEFAEKFDGTEHVTYDSVSLSGLLDAHEEAFGKRAIPRYRFDKAEVIMGINCDFLGTWLSPAEHMTQWAKGRRVTGGKDKHTMSRHFQLESVLSTTGAKADIRIPMKPSHEAEIIIKLYNYIVENSSGDGMEIGGNSLKGMADELKKSRGKSLVVSGTNDKELQLLVAAINSKLQSYGNTLDLDTACNLRQGSDAKVDQLVKDMAAGKVDVVIFNDCNPVYNYHDAKRFKAALKKVKTTVAIDTHETETAAACDYILAANHSLETWGDAQPYEGIFTIQQPTITPLFDTRSFEQNLLRWMGEKPDFYTYIRKNWKETAYPNAEAAGTFKDFWREALRTGTFESKSLNNGAGSQYDYVADVSGLKATLRQRYTKSNGFEVVTYQKTGIGDGKLANLPWLQEMPDSITRCTWDNYALVPLAYAKENGIATGDVINLSAGQFNGKVPAVVQPGLHPEVIGVALGYGRKKGGKAVEGRGFNAFPVQNVKKGYVLNFAEGKMSQTDGETYDLAFTQVQSTAVNDSRKEHIVKERTLVDFVDNPNAIREERQEKASHLLNMYPDYRLKPGEGHRWVMAIDLNACTGCGACVVSCQSENNVAVVGKKEVMTGREMHWIRIDRYYSAAEETRDSVKDAEYPEAFPDVVFEPMLCQHCDNAPCENVCPVMAIGHSSEGVNSMVYNRCVGTRYCEQLSVQSASLQLVRLHQRR